MKLLAWIAAAILIAGLMFYALTYKSFVLDAVTWAPAARADDQSYMHAQGHNDYRNWSSTKIQNCCNNQDCRGLHDEEWRENDNGTEVLIEGQWCPVLQEHRLIRGKSPNWEVAHACIRPKLPGSNVPPCERLLCFVATPKG